MALAPSWRSPFPQRSLPGLMKTTANICSGLWGLPAFPCIISHYIFPNYAGHKFWLPLYRWNWKSFVSNSLQPRGLYSPWNSPGQNTGVSSLALLQGIFLTQGSNPGLLHCRWILYQLSHKGSLWPGGSEGKASACNEGDLDSIPELGGSPGEGNGNPLQYSCLENSMDGGAW